MKLRIQDIPSFGITLTAKAPSSSDDKWFGSLLRSSFGDPYREGVACLSLQISKTIHNVSLSGHLSVILRPSCARCLEEFETRQEIAIKMLLSPPLNSDDEEDEAISKKGTELDDDDQVTFYHSNVINLSEILEEQILLSIPIRFLCHEDCKGLCPQCGHNLNHETCPCQPVRPSPFVPLKSFWPGK